MSTSIIRRLIANAPMSEAEKAAKLKELGGGRKRAPRPRGNGAVTLFTPPAPITPQCLTLPYPPSVNHYWRQVNGHAVLSAEARDYKRRASQIAFSAGLKIIYGPVSVLIDIYRERKARDLDNCLKATLDSLCGVAFEDDSQVIGIFTRRFDDRHNPRAEVTCVAGELTLTRVMELFEGRAA